MKPYYQDESVTLYHGDCREILPQITELVDLVLTDPPYGVSLGEVDNGQARAKNQQPYTMFSDTQGYLETVVIPAFKTALKLAPRAVMTPGNRNAFLYPPPSDIGVWYNPAGTGRGKWGFILAHLIFYYGIDPRAGTNATASSTWNRQRGDGLSGDHPCPKPLEFARWLVQKGSLEGETILDPFAGSGTTLRAAKDLGRKSIGIEIEERYCEIAAKRMSQMVLPL